MPVEIGGVNSMVPLALSSRLGKPVVDADCMGRAFPEGQLVTLTLDGIGMSPVSLADERGNNVILETCDNFWLERFGRSLAIDFGAIAAGVGAPITGRQVRQSTVHGSLSYAERIGRAIREARAAKQDGVAAILRETQGFEIFRGKITDVQRRIERGWTLGEAILEGSDESAGSRMVCAVPERKPGCHPGWHHRRLGAGPDHHARRRAGRRHYHRAPALRLPRRGDWHPM